MYHGGSLECCAMGKVVSVSTYMNSIGCNEKISLKLFDEFTFHFLQ